MQALIPQSDNMQQTSNSPAAKFTAHTGFLAKVGGIKDTAMHSLEIVNERSSQLLHYDSSNTTSKATVGLTLTVAAGFIARRFGLVRL